MVVVPLGPALLALEEDEFLRAVERGRELMPASPPVTDTPQIVDAAGAEAATGVPASWWLDAARRGEVPHLRIGKYVRFDLGEVIDATRQRGRLSACK